MLNWLLVGIGDIAKRRVIPAILEEPRSLLIGLVTRDPAKAEPYGVRGWRSLDDAMAESGADAVYIATPPHLHKTYAIQCAEAGKPVYVEKPMALDARECEIGRASCRERVSSVV